MQVYLLCYIITDPGPHQTISVLMGIKNIIMTRVHGDPINPSVPNYCGRANIPGGGDNGQPAIAAAYREFREETDIDFANEAMFGFYCMAPPRVRTFNLPGNLPFCIVYLRIRPDKLQTLCTQVNQNIANNLPLDNELQLCLVSSPVQAIQGTFPLNIGLLTPAQQAQANQILGTAAYNRMLTQLQRENNWHRHAIEHLVENPINPSDLPLEHGPAS